MTRIYQQINLTPATTVTLDPSASHHLARVLRAKVGDNLVLFNGNGGEYDAIITEITKKSVNVQVGEYVACDRESPIHLYLAQGMARGEKMDFIVQKAVELGVKKIFPLVTERVNVQLKGDREAKRLDHWRAVAVSACEQSGRTQVPEVMAPQLLRDFLANKQADYAFVLSPHVAGALGEVAVQSGQSVVLLIGSEGGLSDDEVAAALAGGYQPLNLGPRVLRTETATIAALTVLQSKFGDV